MRILMLNVLYYTPGEKNCATDGAGSLLQCDIKHYLTVSAIAQGYCCIAPGQWVTIKRLSVIKCQKRDAGVSIVH